ncbi:Hsp20 family protein [Alloiococcus sp. CFN-8]|uniref:Hsp20 family protein n=1 Tax=Alloiococcus sp. CFN-8 TaxID=3416081 RepID=UPI003CE76FBB
MRSLIPFNVSPKNIINCEEFFDDFFNSFFVDKSFKFNYVSDAFSIDLYEDEDQYIIEADLPGIPSEDIQVDYINNFIVIAAFRRELEDKRTLQKEKHYGELRRMFYIEKIIPEKIKLSYSHGVMTVFLPKG